MDFESSVYTIQPVYSILANLLSIVSLVCLWKIFEDFGQSGWKALIPCYSTLTLGRCCDDEEDGKKAMIFGLCTIAATLLLFLSAAMLLLASYSSSAQSGSITILSIVVLISFLFMFAAFIATFIYVIKIKSTFVKMVNEESWLTLLWVLIPVAGDVYMAFFRKGPPKESITQD